MSHIFRERAKLSSNFVSCPPEGSRVLDVVNPIVDKALA
jgi:hypothetical protein